MRRAGILLVFALVLSACGGSGGGTSATPAGTPKAGGTLKVVQPTELNGLDPLNSGLLIEREIFYNIYDSLVAIDPQLNIKGSLATSWDTPDAKTYVFHLRKDVRFQDGTEFNAEVVKFNIDRYLTDPKSLRKSELASVESVEVKDPLTAVFHLKNSDGTLLAQLVDRAGMMVSPEAIKKGGQDFTRNPVGAGTGPFQFVEWKRQDHLTIKKNPNYWRKGLPYLDEITYFPNTNTDTFASGLKTGEFDFAQTIPGKDVASMKSDSSLSYRQIPELGWRGMEVNHGAPPFNDLKKAQAVALAIDRAQILKNVQFNVGQVAYGPISPVSWAYDPSEKIYDKPDLEKAKTLAGGPFEFTLLTDTTPEGIQTATLIQSQLAKVGITVKVQPTEFGPLTLNTRQHNFQAAVSGWSGRIDPDGNMFAFFHTGGSFNDGQFTNPKVDQLVEQARSTTDRAQRKQLYQQAQRTIVEDVGYVFFRWGVVQLASRDTIHGFTLYPDGMNRFVETWKT